MLFGGAVRINKRGYVLIGILILLFLLYHFNFKDNTKSTPKELSILSLLKTAIYAAEAGGERVVKIKNDIEVKSKGKTQEGMDDTVTTADFQSHCVMESIIKKEFPNVKFISEEKNIKCEINEGSSYHYNYPETKLSDITAEFVNSDDVTIWIDPLDATHEYTEKLYHFVTTMVCVAVKGEPVIGVIHNPFEKDTFWAVSEKHYSENLKSLKHNVKSDSSGKIKIVISRSHGGKIHEVLQKNFKNYEIFIAAGAGYKVLKVAKAEVDAYLHITAIKKWDICAGHAILKALGGKMTTKTGETIYYFNDTDVVNKNGLIATLKNHELFLNKL